jgi:signal peptidase II
MTEAVAATYRKAAYLLAGGIAVIDQIVKYVMTDVLMLRERGFSGIELIPFFKLTWAENRGISMGFFHAETDVTRWLLVAMTAAISTFVFFWIWREKVRGDALALGLVLGGAIGNIIDRARLGYVIDYADFHIGTWRPFLIFNLADAAISIGVFILLARALLVREKTAAKESR